MVPKLRLIWYIWQIYHSQCRTIRIFTKLKSCYNILLNLCGSLQSVSNAEGHLRGYPVHGNPVLFSICLDEISLVIYQKNDMVPVSMETTMGYYYNLTNSTWHAQGSLTFRPLAFVSEINWITISRVGLCHKPDIICRVLLGNIPDGWRNWKTMKKSICNQSFMWCNTNNCVMAKTLW